jgi:hypothetical protein
VSQERFYSRTVWPWRSSHRTPPKPRLLYTNRHCVTTQKTWILNTAVRTSNLLKASMFWIRIVGVWVATFIVIVIIIIIIITVTYYYYYYNLSRKIWTYVNLEIPPSTSLGSIWVWSWSLDNEEAWPTGAVAPWKKYLLIIISCWLI